MPGTLHQGALCTCQESLGLPGRGDSHSLELCITGHVLPLKEAQQYSLEHRNTQICAPTIKVL